LNNDIVIGLVYNAALLLVLSIIYNTFFMTYENNKMGKNILTGIGIGVIGVLLMLTPLKLIPGVFFDTRSILISVAAMFFGFVPTAIAVIIICATRILIGGSGALMGVLVVISTAAIGLLWNKFHFKYIMEARKNISVEFYIVGILAHIAMLLCVFALPQKELWPVLKNMWLPVLLIYPIVSFLLSAILYSGLKNNQTRLALIDSENNYKALYLENQNKQTFLKTLIDSVPDLVFYKDNNSVYVGCNAAFEKFTTMTENELIGRTDWDLFSEEQARLYIAQDKETLECGKPTKHEDVCTYPDGTEVYLETLKTTYSDKQGNLLGLIGISRDNTENKLQEVKLTKMCELRDIMLETNNAIITMSDLNDALKLILESALKAMEKASMGTVFIFENNKFKVASYVGFTKELEEFLLPVNDAFLYVATDGKMDRIVSTGNFQEFEKRYPIKTNLGEDSVIQSTISSPIYIKEAFMGMINIDSTIKNAFDEDDVKTMEFVRNNIEIAITNNLAYSNNASKSKHDSLTQLHNRYSLLEQFDLVKENAISNNEKFFVVMVDIDGLKNINDEYGHLAGDNVIVRISSEIFRKSSKHDIVARFGGDEFVGIFLNTKIEALELLLDSIKLGMLECPVFYRSSKIIPSFTYGISSFPDDGCELNELIKTADERMYIKKKLLKKTQSN